EAAEEVAVRAVRPVLVDDELGERAAPVREMELPGSLAATVVRLESLPGLEGPVAAVRGLAGLDQPGQRGAVVGEASAPAARAVTDPELDLRAALARCAGVDRPRCDQEPSQSSAAVAHVRVTV